jgi:hypothetical protein
VSALISILFCIVCNVLNSVLKRRENRLRHEQSGLKALISGLVGGNALLKEWEREWKERFGGEEKDEIPLEQISSMRTADDDDEDDDGSDGEGDDADDEEGGSGGRKRKRAKVEKAPAASKGGKKEAATKAAAPASAGSNTTTVTLPDGTVVEKRKRGRPRKNAAPLAPAAAATNAAFVKVEPHTGVAIAVAPQQQQHGGGGGQAQQYLLATFALFSFFNSPLTSSSASSWGSSHSHTHSQHSSQEPGQGHVLSSHPPTAANGTMGLDGLEGWGWREVIQAFHLVVSICVLASILLPWLGGAFGFGGVVPKFRFLRTASAGSDTLSASSRSNVAAAKGSASEKSKTKATPTPAPERPATVKGDAHLDALKKALSFPSRGKSDEDENLRAALGGASLLSLSSLRWGKKDEVRRLLEHRAWMRLGELVVLSSGCYFLLVFLLFTDFFFLI